jgi:putative acetyltransferase
MTITHIRRIQPDDRAPLLSLWERSVRATHHFLAEGDIELFRPLVAEFLAGEATELWVLRDDQDRPIGFLGLSAHAIEALFLDPDWRGRGCGRLLVEHAQARRGGTLAVDVNEQNVAARGFYEALGFIVTGRSPVDDTGRPYPVLHMRRERIEWQSRGI